MSTTLEEKPVQDQRGDSMPTGALEQMATADLARLADSDHPDADAALAVWSARILDTLATESDEDFAALSDEDLTRLAKTNRRGLAVLRERRFRRREARLQADTTLDPRLRELLLDREIWGTVRQRQETGLNQPRLSALRGGHRGFSPTGGLHPVQAPDMDVNLGIRGGRIDQGVEAGRWREWEIHSGRKVWDSEIGALVKTGGPHRHGRAPRQDEQEAA